MNGDCFEVALHFAMNLRGDDDEYRVVHGWPIGQGPIAGLRHAHAWIERHDPIPANLPEHFARVGPDFFTVCIDRSNGKDVELPRTLYYGIGHIRPDECSYYTPAEAMALAVRSGHFGPWDGRPSGA